MKLLLLSHEFVNSVVLAKRKTRSLLDNLVKFGDFILESLDDLSGFFLFLLGSFNEFPAFLNLSSEDSNGVGILLGEFDSSLNSSSVLENVLVELLASLNESLLTFIRSFQSSVKLLVLLSELFHGLISDKFVKNLLEILLQGFILCWVDTHLYEVIIHLPTGTG